MSLRIDIFVTGPLAVSTYLLRSDDDCCAVDPGGPGPHTLEQVLVDKKIELRQIWLTHGHGDHIAGVGPLKERFPSARLCCPAADAAMLTDAERNLSRLYEFSVACPAPDELIRPGDALTIGQTQWLALDTSGHTPGGMSYYCRDEGVVLTGDALFSGGIGRTDLPAADSQQLLENIRRQLLSLPDDTKILPGHGPTSTIQGERRFNPFLQFAPQRLSPDS